MSRKYRNIAILLIVGMTFLLRVPFLSVPPERDEGVYAVVAETILDGGVPYRDAVLWRAPAIFYTYAALFKLFGETVGAIRIGAAVFALLTLLIVFRLASRLYGENTGLLAALLFGVFSSGPLIQGGLGNTEVFMMLPAVAATYAFYLWHKEQRNSYLLLAGILAGISCLFKEATLPNLLFFFVFLPLATNPFKTGLKMLLKGYVLLSIGFAIPITIFLSYLFVNGALSDYLIGTYNWNSSYGSHDFSLFKRRLIDRGIYSLGREYSFLWLSAALFVFLTIVKERTVDNMYVILWIMFSFVGVCLGSKFFPHYFIQMIPSLSIASGSAIFNLYKGLREQRIIVKMPSYIYVALLLLSLGYAIKTDYKSYLFYTPDEISKEIYGDEIFVNYKKIAEYVRERTKPSDYIYQNRWDSGIYFLARRRPPTKYIEHYAIQATKDVKKSMDELRDDILIKKPKYIIWYSPRPSEIPKFVVEPIIKWKYDKETEIGGAAIYRLKDWSGNE